MSFITLEQHFYGSAPIGLSASRGYQTVAKSAGCVRHEVVEKHCSFFRPSAKNELRPVNWGWLRLADERVCLHRIAYSGNDELGRPGNFLAHNLIANPDELDAIDYDVPSLLRWVIEKSPVRYPLPDGTGDGFCRRHDQIYEKLGWNPKRPQETPSSERSKLATLEALKIPVADLRALRAEADAVLGGILENRGFIDRILHALLADAAQRKPVLLIGASDGIDQSALERRIVEVLFTLLPYHCRKRLTFATYCGLAPGSSGTALPDRRLLMTTRHNAEFRIAGTGENFPAWVVDGAAGGAHKLPTQTQTAKIIARLFSDRRSDDLRKLREAASAFDFPEETKGIALAMEIPRLKQASIAEQFLHFHKVARSIRPGFTSLLKTAQRLVMAWTELPSQQRKPEDLKNTAEAYVVAIERLLPAPEEESRIVETLVALFAAAFDNQVWSVLSTIARTLGSSEKLKPLCKTLLDRFYEYLATRESVYPLPGELQRWCNLCNALEVGTNESDHVYKEFVRRYAESMGRQFFALPRGKRHLLAAAPKDFILEILRRLPPAIADETWTRLAFVRDVEPKHDRLLELYLIELWKKQELTPPVVDSIVRTRLDLILKYYPVWRALSDLDPRAREILQPAFDDPELSLAMWSIPPEEVDEPLLRSALALLEDWLIPERGELRRALARSTAKNFDVILARLERNDLITNQVLLADIGRFYAEFIRLVIEAMENPRSSEDEQVLESLQSIAPKWLAQLIAFLLTRPLATQMVFAPVLEEPVKSFRMWHKGPDRMTEAANVIADCCHAMHPVRGGRDWPLISHWREELAKKHEGKQAPPQLSEIEIEWLTLCLESVPAAGAGADRAKQVLLVAKLLFRRPDLIQKPRNDFEEYFKEFRSQEAVWRILADQLERDLSGGRLENWLKEEPSRGPLVEGLRRRELLSDVGKQATAQLLSDNGSECLKWLDGIAKCPWRELSDPARKAAIQRRVTQWIEFFLSPPSTLPLQDRCQRLLDRCRDVSDGQEDLPFALKWKFWTCLAEAIAILPPKPIVDWLSIRDVGRTLPMDNLKEKTVWLTFFQILAERGKDDLLPRSMVAIAEALFSPRMHLGNFHDEPAQAASEFAMLWSLSEEQQFSRFFEGNDPSKPTATTDLFLPCVVDLPAVFYEFDDYAESILIGRARLLSHHYGRFPEIVLSWIAHWARVNRSGVPLDYREIFLGRALGGFLTASNKTERYITSQAEVMLKEKNWVALRLCRDLLLNGGLGKIKSLMKALGLEREATEAVKLLKIRLGL